MPTPNRFLPTRAVSYSACLAAAAAGAPLRGSIHSAFNAAANIAFPGGLILSLNALDSPRMPNGLELSTPAGTFPFTRLRPGMPALLGAQRLLIESADCSLDLSHCALWNPSINRPEHLNSNNIVMNREWLANYLSTGPSLTTRPRARSMDRALLTDTMQECIPARAYLESGWKLDILPMAHYLCGRGAGLTPSGDDILTGWMSINWLLYVPLPCLLEAYQQIITVATQQTHLLSWCWLGYAAEGNVAQPVLTLLNALTGVSETELATAAQAVIAMGATSGHDLLQGILLGLAGF